MQKQKMANLCISVLVLLCLQNVFANYCEDMSLLRSCDECMRCGGNWCNKLEKSSEVLGMGHQDRCTNPSPDNWCLDAREQLPYYPANETSSDLIQPSYSEKMLKPGNTDSLVIRYQAPHELNVTYPFKSTQTNDAVTITHFNSDCRDKKCEVTIETSLGVDFCRNHSSIHENIYVNVKFEDGREMVVKYHVPCACLCSLPKNILKKSELCSGNGDLVCGVCKCYEGWGGEDCGEETQCASKRGDVQCTNSQKSEVECSGNGYCSKRCEICICDREREGSQYFDPDNYCADICMSTSDCDSCLVNGTLGQCPDECGHVSVEAFNQTAAEARDGKNRKIWASCNEVVDHCYIEYVAMKEHNNIRVMVIKSCNQVLSPAAIGTVQTQAPLILGILAIIATVGALAGVAVWKYLKADPPLPLTDPKYENIDAEDCTGINPLYKPPTSSFKNPMYEKC